MEKIYSTENIRLAASLATIGFELREAVKIEDEKIKSLFIFSAENNIGLPASYFEEVFSDVSKNEVDALIEKYGIAPEDAAKIMFDPACIAQKNRTTLHLYLAQKQPIYKKAIGNRMLLYYAGTPPEKLKQLVNE